jgi:hypothetical protein
VRFDGNRFYHVMAGEDERQGGALLFFNLRKPLAIAGGTKEYRSPMKYVADARLTGDVWIDIEKPFWWDVALWLASGKMDSIGLANNHMCRDRMYETEAWGKPRLAERLPAPLGNGYWTQDIYYHALNTGLRLPPSAGSASGVLPNPVGYNRVYVHVGGAFDYPRWWEGLKAGRCFVTNGPLLLCKANGELPGHVFRDKAGGRVEVKLECTLLGNDRVRKLEVIRDGRVERTIPVEEGTSGPYTARLSFAESGWFLVRAVADNPRTFRFASTGPFYVEAGKERLRVSKQSARFFLDWEEERIGQLERGLKGAEERREVLGHHEKARRFWRDKVAQANAD